MNQGRKSEIETMPPYFTLSQLSQFVALLRAGGVVAYPTEAVYGLGCDPQNQSACAKLLALKQRSPDQGVLLVAAHFDHISHYIDLTQVPPEILTRVRQDWPGPHTWVFPRTSKVPNWIVGTRDGIALRVTAHAPTVALSHAFGGALVSTSANPHGEPAARSVQNVADYFGASLDGVLDAPLGQQVRPSSIRDVLSGVILRA